MDRKINWITGCHDEIELVYEKAEQNEMRASVFFCLNLNRWR